MTAGGSPGGSLEGRNRGRTEVFPCYLKLLANQVQYFGSTPVF